GEILVGRPGEGAMIDDDVVRSAARGQCIDLPAAHLFRTGLARPDADVLHDDVVGEDGETAPDQRDSRGRRSLTGNRQVGLANRDVFPPEIDDAADFEDDDAWPGSFHSLAERSGTLCSERGYAHERAAPSARRVRCPAERSGKREWTISG